MRLRESDKEWSNKKGEAGENERKYNIRKGEQIRARNVLCSKKLTLNVLKEKKEESKRERRK